MKRIPDSPRARRAQAYKAVAAREGRLDQVKAWHIERMRAHAEAARHFADQLEQEALELEQREGVDI